MSPQDLRPLRAARRCAPRPAVLILMTGLMCMPAASGAAPPAAERVTDPAFDSLLAADAELAARLEAVDLEAAQDERFLESQASALAQLESHPEEAAAIFAAEEAPTYTGSDPVIVVYVHYLRAHPAYYRAWWRVYDYLRGHPPIARAFYAHGR
jgi:hypothetical protein